MTLNINKINVTVSVHDLAVANNVSDAQMASFIYRNLYRSLHHMEVAEKIRRHSVAITNLASQL